MNGRQRYVNTLQGQPVDHLARVPILMQYAAEHIGSNYGAFASDYRVLTEANLRCAEEFGFDQVSTISDPYRETAGFGGRIEYVRDGVPRCHLPPLADSTDLSALPRPDPFSAERMLDRIRAVETYRQRTQDHSILGWVEGPAAEAADLRGVGTFLVDLLEEPEFCAELMDRCIETAIAFAQAQIAAGADTIGIGDAVVSQMSPATYEELVFPREKKLVEAIHAAGAWVRLHICGNITRHLPVIAGLGIDLLDCDWMVDLGQARAALGEKVVLTGNLDPVSAVRNSRPPAIRAAVQAARAAAGRPYMVGAGCEIPSGTPVENLRALCEPTPGF